MHSSCDLNWNFNLSKGQSTEEDMEDAGDFNSPADPESDKVGGWDGPIDWYVGDKCSRVLKEPKTFIGRLGVASSAEIG